jgi:hypothetical protein
MKNSEHNPEHAHQKGEKINGKVLHYGIPKAVLDIYGDLIKFRNLEDMDGEGTGAAKEDVKELKHLLRIGAIKLNK